MTWAPDYGIIRGAPGGVAPLDADGDVTDAVAGAVRLGQGWSTPPGPADGRMTPM